jgi:hypothetical protein
MRSIIRRPLKRDRLKMKPSQLIEILIDSSDIRQEHQRNENILDFEELVIPGDHL